MHFHIYHPCGVFLVLGWVDLILKFVNIKGFSEPVHSAHSLLICVSNFNWFDLFLTLKVFLVLASSLVIVLTLFLLFGWFEPQCSYKVCSYKKSVLLTRNLPFDSSDARRWSHPLMIPLHCLWANSNDRMCGQFECDVTCFCFCFDLVRSHALRGRCSYVFNLCKKIQVGYKMSNKNVNSY